MSDAPTIGEFLRAQGVTEEALLAKVEADYQKLVRCFEQVEHTGQTVFEVI